MTWESASFFNCAHIAGEGFHGTVSLPTLQHLIKSSSVGTSLSGSRVTTKYRRSFAGFPVNVNQRKLSSVSLLDGTSYGTCALISLLPSSNLASGKIISGWPSF